MKYGCDTATIVTAKRLSTIEDNNLVFIGRYLNYISGMHDNITVTEAQRISDAGLYIVSIYEHEDSIDLSHFTKSNGVTDAKDAVSLAEDVGQTNKTPIYFTVDLDVESDDITDYVVPYFSGIKSVLASSTLNPNGYKMGIYGSKLVCESIRGSFAATTRYTWVAGSDDWLGDFDDWNIKQYDTNTTIGTGSYKINIDYDKASSNGSGGWQL